MRGRGGSKPPGDFKRKREGNSAAKDIPVEEDKEVERKEAQVFTKPE